MKREAFGGSGDEGQGGLVSGGGQENYRGKGWNSVVLQRASADSRKRDLVGCSE